MRQDDFARLSLLGISKAFGTVQANSEIRLTVLPGKIHAVLGENGAGKSTLMKIIYGAAVPDAGEIRWNGVERSITSPAAARALGIGMVFQHFSLFPALSVRDNLLIAYKGVAPAELMNRAAALSSRFGMPIDFKARVESLSMGERQAVEMMRCLLATPKLLILDEPTSVLTSQSAEHLFNTLRELARGGCSILYVSHKLQEVVELCDSATILRAGKVMATVDPRQETVDGLSRLMMGSIPPKISRPEPRGSSETKLVASGLVVAQDAPPVDLSVRQGEIVGIGGMAGNGQKALLELLSGERLAPSADMVTLEGASVGRLDIAARRRLGLAYVPEQRLGHGAVPELPLFKNMLLTSEGAGRRGLLRKALARKQTEACIEAYDVRCPGPDVAARTLSGGNLQKFLIGRELSAKPSVLVIAEPSWGLDIKAIADIRRELMTMREAGMGILVVSTDLEELMQISDRIAIISNGRLTPPRSVDETTVEELGLWIGGTFQAKDASAFEVRHAAN